MLTKMAENIVNDTPIFVRVTGKFHDRLFENDRWKLLSQTFPERIYFDEVDEVLIQNGHMYGLPKNTKDWILANKDDISSIISDVKAVYEHFDGDTLYVLLKKIFDMDVWEDMKITKE